MNGVEDSFTEEVDSILAIQDKSTLKSKLTTLLKENHELKERVKELEDTLDGGEIYMIDSVPEEEFGEDGQRGRGTETQQTNHVPTRSWKRALP